MPLKVGLLCVVEYIFNCFSWRVTPARVAAYRCVRWALDRTTTFPTLLSPHSMVVEEALAAQRLLAVSLPPTRKKQVGAIAQVVRAVVSPVT